ncbi:phosphate transport system substrate-binding protein [Thiothrix eikelboomii]|uniref:Phosphate transport system substrate-binding protein n=1 Tax=Thiothrix eikelboomii TaxID=92487 RepID=A0A1T4WHV9_9GAMM|nr:substrate-binding domain-containing protein [Thiothrix eikelboomii]SKA76914.1 phosphate transport system substrate-binding protein [Thiothrix eikelboomii]
MKKLSMAIAAGLLVATSAAQARDNISIVGSSTVYPFTTTVAENYAKKTGNPAPKVESTGTGGGMKLFCEGTAVESADMTGASRRIKESELADCKKNGVSPVEIKIGYDGIAVANAKAADAYNFTRRDLFLALAKEIPDVASSELKLVPNPYKTWKEINPALPDAPIEVLGPPPTSGTRDAFVELVMHEGCKSFPAIKKLEKEDGDQFKKICNSMREDGKYIEAGENDNLIVQKLQANPKAVGIFGFSFLDQNADKVKGSAIEGVEISFENIAAGKYSVSRPMYVYVKKEHVGTVKGIEDFVTELTSDAAWGDTGYLAEKGMIPMPEAERQSFGEAAKGLKVLESL